MPSRFYERPVADHAVATRAPPPAGGVHTRPSVRITNCSTCDVYTRSACPLLLGLVSDAHCNVAAMEAAVERLAPDVDAILFAGDAVYEYRMCNEMIELIRDARMHYVIGNHEIELLGRNGERARSAPGVREDLLDFLRTVPTRFDLETGGKRVQMVHGCPWPPYNEYVTAGSPSLLKCGDADVDFLVLGHTHVPMVEQVNGTLVVNPGSIGESREHGARDLVSYAVLDTDRGEVEIVKFPNPRLQATA
jgi:putative phosphoesterase